MKSPTKHGMNIGSSFAVGALCSIVYVTMKSLVPDFEREQLPCSTKDSFIRPTCKWASGRRGSYPVLNVGRNEAADVSIRRIALCTESATVITSSVESKSAGVRDERQSLSWWISRSVDLPQEHRNGWVVSLILEQYADEEKVASQIAKQTFALRMQETGLDSVLDPSVPPRKRCKALQAAPEAKKQLAEEHAQRLMIKAISRSLPSYMSGLRCWAAFCDAIGCRVHFPATSSMVLRYTAVFASHSTMQQYLKHLRWGHRFLRLDNSWENGSVTQALNGLKKTSAAPRQRLSLVSKDVYKIITEAEEHGDLQTAAMAAVSRLFLLRVPSEAAPLEWDGQHSKVILESEKVTITLMRRKNMEVPSMLERSCCCVSSSPRLCAAHWLHRVRGMSIVGKVFSISAAMFLKKVRIYAQSRNIPSAMRMGSHAFRRGMAQDIVDQGGSLAELLRAGEWHSKAFLKYLRECQAQGNVIAHMVVNLSDSETEC